MKSPLKYPEEAEVAAFDVCAEAMGIEPWRPAIVLEHLFENDEWWYDVKFEDGGRCSILRPKGVRAKTEG